MDLKRTSIVTETTSCELSLITRDRLLFSKRRPVHKKEAKAVKGV